MAKEHKLHIYKRVKHPKRRDLWMCIDPECPRPNHRINQMYLLDKKAQCPHCGSAFTITARKLREQSLLHCDECKMRGPEAGMKTKQPTLDEITTILLEGVLPPNVR